MAKKKPDYIDPYIKNGTYIDFNGYLVHVKNGLWHREDGPAVIGKQGKFEIKKWYINGFLHRENGPAHIHKSKEDNCSFYYLEGVFQTEEQYNKVLPLYLEYKKTIPETGNYISYFGNEIWVKDGLWHREDGPAIIYPDGKKEWRQNGEYHRLDGPAIIYKDGTQEWLQKGKLHRLDGPAIEAGYNEWWFEGKLHREDGPAIILENGISFWYKNGIETTKPDQRK